MSLSQDKLLDYLHKRKFLIDCAIRDTPSGVYGDTEEEKNLCKIIFTNKISIIDEIINFIEKGVRI